MLENSVRIEEDPKDSLELFQKNLVNRYGAAVFESWMADLAFDGLSGDCLTLSTGSNFKAERLNQQFRPTLQSIWSEKIFPIRRLMIVARNSTLASNAQRAEGKLNGRHRAGAAASFAASAAPSSGVAEARGGAASGRDKRGVTLDELAAPLDTRCTFETFATDASNGIAAAAAEHAFVEGAPRELIYIYGPSGVGKSHLLHAIGNRWRQFYPDGSCAYFPYASMRDGCVSAALSNSLYALHREMMAHDLVLIDDIHLLVGANRTLEEILNLVNAFAATGRQLVIAGDRSPLRLAEAGLSQRLADRLAGGLSAPMSPGGEGLRLEALRKRRDRETLRCRISDEALAFIAQKFPQSMREAQGAYNQLRLFYGSQALDVGVAEAEFALRAHLAEVRRRPTLDELLGAAADAFQLTISDLRGRSQPQRIVRARHAYVLIGRDALGESFPRLAAGLGRDHTTAISSYRRAQALFEREKRFQECVASIKAAIGV